MQLSDIQFFRLKGILPKSAKIGSFVDFLCTPKVVVVLSSVVRILGECSTIYFLPACFCCCCCCLSGDRLAHTNSTPYARISSQWFSNLRRLWPNVMYIYKISCVCFHEKTRWLNSLQKCMCNQIVRHFFFFSVCVWKPYFCTICHDRRC